MIKESGSGFFCMAGRGLFLSECWVEVETVRGRGGGSDSLGAGLEGVFQKDIGTEMSLSLPFMGILGDESIE